MGGEFPHASCWIPLGSPIHVAVWLHGPEARECSPRRNRQRPLDISVVVNTSDPEPRFTVALRISLGQDHLPSAYHYYVD